MTTVLPAASAGPSFQLQNMSGKFHGTICPTTPTGWRFTIFRKPGSTGTWRPSILSARPPK